MEERIDMLIEEIESMTQKITKANFELEGFQEEIEVMEDKQPFLVRKIQANKKKVLRVAAELVDYNLQKKDLDAEYGAYQLKKSNETLDKVKKTNPNPKVDKKSQTFNPNSPGKKQED